MSPFPFCPVPEPPLTQPTGVSRSSSSNRANDRLQARLAKAMAGKPDGSRGTPSPRSSVDAASRSSTDRDRPPPVDMDDGPCADAPASDPTSDKTPPQIVEPGDASAADAAAGSATPDDGAAHAPLGEPALQTGQSQGQGQGQEPAAVLSDLAREMEEEKKRQQQEIQDYVERIDSLQAKLQYLSKSNADAAKAALSSAPPGSVERKLAEKDEKIALLMEEGGKLSSAEHRLRTTIKKLRQQMAEHDKHVSELKKSKDKALSDAESLRNRLNSAEGSDKAKEESRRATAALQRELDSMKKERANKDEAYRRLEQEMKTRAEQAEAVKADAHSKALAAERETQRSLEDANEALRLEKEALTEAHRLERIEWAEKMERAAERSRRVEDELRLELRSMENKLEAMRTAAEEASSGPGGEAHVNMFRQIETLQSQYASARENWQGIESSLLARLSGLKRERDEAQQRESEMRKKARDAVGNAPQTAAAGRHAVRAVADVFPAMQANRNRQLGDELADAQAALAAVRQESEALHDQVADLGASSRKTTEALEQAKADLDRARKRSVSRGDGVDGQRRVWADDVAGATSRGGLQSRPDSPLLSVPRTFSSDVMSGGLPLPGKPRRTPTSGSVPDSPAETMSPARRLSGQPPLRLGLLSSMAPGPPPAPYSPFEAPSDVLQLPSPPAPERDSGADEAASSSPRNLAQDMISVSTVAAGPSVQLVERMSAAIRRLEAEKVAAKEEMARVCGQRDEARSDMVGLIKDLDEAKAAARRVPELEEAVSRLDSRYQTTLEMLGEKSERVEELRADVEDVKTMYRELVERMTVT